MVSGGDEMTNRPQQRNHDMKMKTTLKIFAGLLALAGLRVQAQLPADFPTVTVTTDVTNAVSSGDIFLGAGSYVTILDNTGAPVWYQDLPPIGGLPLGGMDVKLLPNGLLHWRWKMARPFKLPRPWFCPVDW
jgi:hypothetical protein